MRIEVNNTRVAKLMVDDFVALHPNYMGTNDVIDFFRFQPVKVLEVDAVINHKPYTFKYFLENHEGERMFLEERFLLLVSAERDAPHLTVYEPSAINSEYDVGDKFYDKMVGEVVAVTPKYDEHNLPSFSYLVEFPNRTRKRFHI